MAESQKSKTLFTLSQIDEDIAEGSKMYLELKELFDKASSLDDIIDSWMNRELGRELSFSAQPGNLDESTGEPVILVLLEEGAKEIAVAQCAKEALVNARKISFSIDEANHTFHDQECNFDEDWYNRRDETLSIEFNDIYGEHQIPRENVEKLLLSYLGSKVPTEIELFFVDEESLADSFMDAEAFDELMAKSKNYVCMNLVVFDRDQATASSGEFISFFLAKDVVQ